MLIEWEKITEMEEAKKSIDAQYNTGTRKFKPCDCLEFCPIKNKEFILDFGSGIGRNIPYIKKVNPTALIYLYDLPNMLHLAKKHLKKYCYSNLFYLDYFTWISFSDGIKRQSIDLIIADLVLQHISWVEQHEYLKLFKELLKPNGVLWIHSRGWSDYDEEEFFKTPIWRKIIKYFKPQFNLRKYDSEKHQWGIFK